MACAKGLHMNVWHTCMRRAVPTRFTLSHLYKRFLCHRYKFERRRPMNNSLAERNHYFFDAIPSHKLKCYGMESEKAQLFVGCAHRDRNMINHLKFAETNCSLAIQLSLH